MEQFAHAITLVDLVKSLMETGVAFLGFISALAVIWRKVQKAITTYTERIDDMSRRFADVVRAQEVLSNHQVDLTKALAILAERLEGRERDISKIEGSLDTTRKDMMQLVSAIHQSTSSLDALWRTLQTLFPGQVPTRASDKR
jgi:chromosome segregation ATPase